MPVASQMRPVLFLGAFLAAGLTTTLAVGPALAQQSWVVTAPLDADGVRTVSVRYDDLNLTSVAGRDRLSRRVRGAVRLVCPAALGVTHVKEQQLVAGCRRVAMDGARPQLDQVFASAARGERFAAATIEIRAR